MDDKKYLSITAEELDQRLNLVPDMNSQIASLTNDVNAHKAEKATQATLGHIRLQENFIDIPLQNGWTIFGDGVRYAKNDLGVVTLCFLASVGTNASYTIIASLAEGYRPIQSLVVGVRNFITGARAGFVIVTNSDIQVADGVDGDIIEFQVSYYAS